jgi:hypothetical protein
MLVCHYSIVGVFSSPSVSISPLKRACKGLGDDVHSIILYFNVFIYENTDFMVLLSQAQGDRKILAAQLGISEHQLSYITHSQSGEGLLFFGNVTIPFVDRFPPGEIYDLLTTRPEDIAKAAQNE